MNVLFTSFDGTLDLVAQLEIENNYFATSLSVLEDQPMDMLLGLDMLRRHQVFVSFISQSVNVRFLLTVYP